MNNQTVYHIPANYTDAGKVMGFFELRNVMEAAVLAVPTVLGCVALARLTPFSVTVKLILSLCLVVPICGFALIGIRDDPLSRFVLTYIRWRRSRRILIHKGETIQYDAKGSYFRNSGRSRKHRVRIR